jgi:hypothetical protein
MLFQFRLVKDKQKLLEKYSSFNTIHLEKRKNLPKRKEEESAQVRNERLNHLLTIK